MTFLRHLPPQSTLPKGVHSPRVEAAVERAIAESALTGQPVTLLCGPESVRDAALCAALEARQHEDWTTSDGRFVRAAGGRRGERLWNVSVVEMRPSGKVPEHIWYDFATEHWPYWVFFAAIVATTFFI